MNFATAIDIPDLTGKVIFVTGGTDGIGKEYLRRVSRHNPAKIYLAARNLFKAQATVTEIKSQIPPSQTCPVIEVIEMELSSLATVHKAAQKFLTQEDRLDVLLCNAGILMGNGVTTDGYEMVFGTNHLGHSLLISLLLPRLLFTAKLPGINEGDTRCVIVASSGEAMAGNGAYHFSTMKSDLRHLNMWMKYGQSKLANVHSARALAAKYPEEESRVRFIAIHPGTVATNMGNQLIPNKYVRQALRPLFRIFLDVVTPEVGAYNSLWAAHGPSHVESKSEKMGVVSSSGEFYYPVGKMGKGSKKSYDLRMANDLWAWTEKELEPWVEQ